MMYRSSRSTAEALVHHGRALRRVCAPKTSATPVTSGTGRVLRGLFVLLLTGLAGLAVAPAAWAHGPSDLEIAAVMDRAPDMPGVDLSVRSTELGSQFLLENPTPTEVTVLSAAGDPFLRIGPGGVLANFRSPDWYTSKLTGGEATVPPRATDRGTPVWVRVSTEPSWGWFDHRLHDTRLDPDQKSSMNPLDPFGAWSVPMTFGDRQVTADGHYEYRPPVGSFAPSIAANDPVPGVVLTPLPGGDTPGMSVENRAAGEVVVLGEAGEPFLRLTPQGTEGNELSPTWLAQRGSAAGQGGDPAAPPRWTPAGAGSQVSFTMPWARADRAPAELYAMSGSEDVKNWTVGLVVDGQRVDVPGVTTFNPADRGGSSTWWWIGGSVVVLVVVGGGVWWWLRRNRTGHRGGGTGERPRGAHREKVDA